MVDKTIREISDDEGVTKHAVKERMQTIPDFDRLYTHIGRKNGRRCILVNPKGVNLLHKTSYTYRSINHKNGKSETKTPTAFNLEKSRHELQEAKTARQMMLGRLSVAKSLVSASKRSMADIRNERDRWYNVASSAQAEMSMASSKDNEIKKLALKSQASSYEAKLHSANLNDSSLSSLRAKNKHYRQTVNSLKNKIASKPAKHKNLWQRIFSH